MVDIINTIKDNPEGIYIALAFLVIYAVWRMT